MVIDIANFNFDGGSGGGGKPALLQEKTVTIVENGSQTITPDEGFDGMSSVQINAAITGASSAIDFSSIGYDAELSAELNSKFNDDVAYSKQLYDAWNPSRTSSANLYNGDKKLVYAPAIDTSNVINMNSMFKGCTSLTSVPAIDTSNATDIGNMFNGCSNLKSVPLFDTINVNNMSFMFNGCSSLTSVPAIDTINATNMWHMFSDCTNLKTVPEMNTSNVKNMSDMFNGCSSLTSVPAIDTSNATDMDYMFSYCSSLTSIPELDTSKAVNMSRMFSGCDSLTTIEGISFKSLGELNIDEYYLFGWGENTSIRKAVFKDIGYQSTAIRFNTSYATNWGVNTDEIPDARQSLIDSLITYSFDRLSAGYPTCTIKLSSTTKALLTEDEIAQIEAKGFTIA